MLFTWVRPLIQRAHAQQQLQFSDLLVLPSDCSPKYCSAKLSLHWRQVRRSGGNGGERSARPSHRPTASCTLRHHCWLLRMQGCIGKCCVMYYYARRPCCCRLAPPHHKWKQCPCCNPSSPPAQERALPTPSLLRALVHAFGGPYFRLALLKVGRLMRVLTSLLGLHCTSSVNA